MFSFFHKNKSINDLSWLGLDMHNHLLPGIDDGATDLDQSTGFIKNLTALGFSHFICTPHIYTELYPNTRQSILTALATVQMTISTDIIKAKVSAGAEYMIDETFKVNQNLVCLSGKYILIEMSYLAEMRNIEQVIFDLQIIGYKVILAHPERYLFYHTNVERYSHLKKMGVLFQLNLLSLSGYYSKEVKQVANFLLNKKWYDFAGTDLHHQKHLNQLQSITTSGILYKMIGNYPFKNKELIW